MCKDLLQNGNGLPISILAFSSFWSVILVSAANSLYSLSNSQILSMASILLLSEVAGFFDGWRNLASVLQRRNRVSKKSLFRDIPLIGATLMVGRFLTVQHFLNPLHLYCRFRDIGLNRHVSFKLCRYYESLIFVWFTLIVKMLIRLCFALDRSRSILEELRKK
jgi:hypothetical protein